MFAAPLIVGSVAVDPIIIACGREVVKVVCNFYGLRRFFDVDFGDLDLKFAFSPSVRLFEEDRVNDIAFRNFHVACEFETRSVVVKILHRLGVPVGADN